MYFCMMDKDNVIKLMHFMLLILLSKYLQGKLIER